jgi:hypothetical protein
VPYSLVSAATLGFDLVRLPAGRAVAEVLLTGLNADTATLERLAAAHPGREATAAQRGVLAVRSRRARELASGVPHVSGVTQRAATATGEDRTAVLVTQLERGMIGNAPTLERLLREDVLGPEHTQAALVDDDLRAEAADVLADAAIGFWAAEVLPPLVHRELAAAYHRAAVAWGGLPDLGATTDELAELLGSIAALDGAGRGRWRAATDDGRAEHRPWASAMHDACWAAHVSGRTRTLAAAQLHAVRAFLDGGFDGRDGAHGVWNAVAGCVQAVVMADLLDEASLEVLRAPWVRVRPRS